MVYEYLFLNTQERDWFINSRKNVIGLLVIADFFLCFSNLRLYIRIFLI